jgi:hypothetical protein
MKRTSEQRKEFMNHIEKNATLSAVRQKKWTAKVWSKAIALMLVPMIALPSQAGGYPVYDALVHTALTMPGVPGLYDAIGRGAAANEAVAKSVAAETAQRETNREAQNLERDLVRDNLNDAKKLKPTGRACAEIAQSKVASVSRAGGGRSAAGMAKKIADSRDTVQNPLEELEQTLAVKKIDPQLCTSTDVRLATQRGNNCTQEGVRANAQRKAASIYMAAGTGEGAVMNTNGTAKFSGMEEASYTMDQQQSEAAFYTIKNVVSGMPPAQLPTDAESSSSGRAYRALEEKYSARLDAATSALIMIASRNKITTTLTTEQQSAWKDGQRKIFEEMYGNRRDFSKAAPTINEVMNLIINEPDLASYKQKTKGYSEEMKELIYRTNVNNQVQWMAFKQNERLLAVQASALAHQIEPVSKDMLTSTYNAAISQKK